MESPCRPRAPSTILRRMATRVTDELGEPDAVFETSLRPVAFEEFGGQDKVRERLGIAVTAKNVNGIPNK